MIANAKIETVFTGVFFKIEFEYKFIAMDKQEAKQKENQKRKAARPKPS